MRWFIAVCTALAILAAPAFAAPPADQVRAAGDKGVAYLKNNPGSHNDDGNGRQALAGLALLAGGCTPADADVARIAGQIRGTCIGDDATYHVALSMLFLDKLGDPADEGLIQLLGVK